MFIPGLSGLALAVMILQLIRVSAKRVKPATLPDLGRKGLMVCISLPLCTLQKILTSSAGLHIRSSVCFLVLLSLDQYRGRRRGNVPKPSDCVQCTGGRTRGGHRRRNRPCSASECYSIAPVRTHLPFGQRLRLLPTRYHCTLKARERG